MQQNQKNIALYPFRLIYLDLTEVKGASEAEKHVKEIGGIYEPDFADVSWYDRFPVNNISILGIGVVEFTGGDVTGKRGYYYYGCNEQGNIFNKPPNVSPYQ